MGLDMTNNLSEIFAQQGTQQFLEQICNPVVISGAQEFYSRQSEIFSETREGKSVFEWQLVGKPTVLIVNGAFGKKLADLAGVPFISNHYQYPTDEFNQARSGEVVFGMEKAASGIPTAIIQKDLALSLLEPMSKREKDMERVVSKVQDLMDKQGLSAEELLQHLERIEETIQFKPSPSEPVA